MEKCNFRIATFFLLGLLLASSVTAHSDHEEDEEVSDLKDLLQTSMHNIVSLNDLVTELTEKISHLTLSQSETQAEARKRQLDMEDLQRELSQVKEELETLKEPRDGKWAEFGDWSDCSAKCGGGTQTRTRTCTNPAPANGGEYCEGTSQETRECNTEPCTVDGGWTRWGDWGTCSVPCGGDGIETRTRTCTNPAPAHGGADCSGTETDTRPCNNGICTNIARQGTATQTDDWVPGYAGKAIDGIANGDWNRGSVTHTLAQGHGAWWILTFPNPVYIDAIEVYQRTDCCSGESEGTVHVDDRAVGSLRNNRGNPNRISSIRKIGTKVTIRAIRTYLALAEVLVYGAVIEE